MCSRVSVRIYCDACLCVCVFVDCILGCLLVGFFSAYGDVLMSVSLCGLHIVMFVCAREFMTCARYVLSP